MKYPENVSYHFYHELPSLMTLQGKWKVALSDISFENKIRTIVDEKIRVITSPTPMMDYVLLETLSPTQRQGKYITISFTNEHTVLHNNKTEKILQDGYSYPLRVTFLPLPGIEWKQEEIRIDRGDELHNLPGALTNFQYAIWGSRVTPSSNTFKDFAIPPAQYTTEEELVSAVNQVLEGEDIQFSLTKDKKYQLSKLPERKRVELRNGMEHVLGYRTTVLDQEGMNAETSPNLQREGFGFYVSCDLVENMMVGGKSIPLLRMVPLLQTKENITHHIFDTPYHHPVKKTAFQSIALNYMVIGTLLHVLLFSSFCSFYVNQR